MKKFSKVFNATLAISLALVMTSCGLLKKTQPIIPTAVSSVSSPVYLQDLNLTKGDYEIIKTETAEAVVIYEESILGKSFSIKEKNNEFLLNIKEGSDGYDIKYTGIVKYGFLSRNEVDIKYMNPSAIAEGLATYRLINAVQDMGADGIIEPMTTIKVGNDGKKVVFTATISAKLVKIKTK